MAPFGETVLAWRLARGKTQAEVAAAARLSRPNLSAIERGEREVTLKTLRALALALGVRPGVLADGDLPGDHTASLGRAAMERIAGAAVHGRALKAPREARVAVALAAITHSRRQARGGRQTPPQSRGDRAYFFLRATEAPGTIASLIARVDDELGRG